MPDTGPLSNFKRMIVGDSQYQQLLNFQTAVIKPDPSRSHVSKSIFFVSLCTRSGEDVHFIWGLSLQQHGVMRGCWMTDSVAPVSASQLAAILRRSEIHMSTVVQI